MRVNQVNFQRSSLFFFTLDKDQERDTIRHVTTALPVLLLLLYFAYKTFDSIFRIKTAKIDISFYTSASDISTHSIHLSNFNVQKTLHILHCYFTRSKMDIYLLSDYRNLTYRYLTNSLSLLVLGWVSTVRCLVFFIRSLLCPKNG